MPRFRRPPFAKFGKISVMTEGQTHRYYRRKNGTSVVYTICCDCSLVHVEQLTPHKRYISVCCWRDDVYTKRLRRRKK